MRDIFIQLIPFGRSQLFGIVKAGNIRVRRQNDGGSRHRAGQRPPPRLIHAT